jgi:hypothetical protein
LRSFFSLVCFPWYPYRENDNMFLRLICFFAFLQRFSPVLCRLSFVSSIFHRILSFFLFWRFFEDLFAAIFPFYWFLASLPSLRLSWRFSQCLNIFHFLWRFITIFSFFDDFLVV